MRDSIKMIGGTEVSFTDILAFEAEDKNVHITYIAKGNYLAYGKCRDSLTQLLKEYGNKLIRVHRNTVIPVRYLESLSVGKISGYNAVISGVVGDASFTLHRAVSRRELLRVRQALIGLRSENATDSES